MNRKTSNDTKELLFRYPKDVDLAYGKFISTSSSGGSVWTALQVEKRGQNVVSLIRDRDRDGRRDILDLNAGGAGLSVCIAPDGRGGVHTLWNEYSSGWQLHYTRITAGMKREDSACIRNSENLLCDLCLVSLGGSPAAVFAALDGDGFSLYAASPTREDWELWRVVSGANGDLRRPKLTRSGDTLFFTADRYRKKNYEVLLGTIDGNLLKTLQGEKERRLNPVISSVGGTVYLAWLCVTDVIDSRGIVDHDQYVMAGVYHNGEFTLLKDIENTRNPFIIADLRDGLLAKNVYKGYMGLRRNPQLVPHGNDIHLFWESRPEETHSSVAGLLLGRKISGGVCATNQYMSNGYGYAVGHSGNGSLPVSYFSFENGSADYATVISSFLNPGEGTLHTPIVDGLEKWKQSDVELTPLGRERVKYGDEEYSIYWADTHCHSNISSDAYGWPDEVITWARDAAGLDAVAVTDNDYYPNKTYTRAEWEFINALAEHYTRNGFIVFPGYEYTYHRRDLSPDFNHRIVLYPRKGGMLLRRIDSESGSDKKLVAALRGTEALLYPHHSSYEILDNEMELNIEVVSSWRVCLEENDFTMRQLLKGKRLGFIGSSDTHRLVPGMGGALTGLYATANTPEALFDAYRKRRIVATQGFRIFIDFRVGELFIGGEEKFKPDSAKGTEPGVCLEVRGEVKAFETIEYAEVLRNGEPVFRMDGKGKRLNFCFTDTAVCGECFYILKVKLEGEPGFNMDPERNSCAPFTLESDFPHNLARARGVFAWTSPVWVRIESRDLVKHGSVKASSSHSGR